MGIDASRVSVDDAERRPTADLPAARQPEVPPVRAEWKEWYAETIPAAEAAYEAYLERRR